MTPNEFGRLTAVALRGPDAAFRSQQDTERQWKALGYHGCPDFSAACHEFQAFESLLCEAGAEIVHLPAAETLTLDSIYVRDALITTPAGLVCASMGKPARAAEPTVNAAALEAAGFPVAGTIEGSGRLEGGDLVWLDPETLIAGHTYRTNREGIAQLAAYLGSGVAVHTLDMPHFRGPGDVFHLMSVLSPIDRDIAVVYPALAPVSLMELLARRGIQIVEVPAEEFDSMGCNVLATAPRQCIMADGNPKTRAKLEAAGATVQCIQATEICSKGDGGPTCLTRPLARSE